MAFTHPSCPEIGLPLAVPLPKKLKRKKGEYKIYPVRDPLLGPLGNNSNFLFRAGAHATTIFPLFHSTTVGREKHGRNGRTTCSSARDEERESVGDGGDEERESVRPIWEDPSAAGRARAKTLRGDDEEDEGSGAGAVEKEGED
ncbi:hypothetical protein E5676_scaffold343G00590 [Cucumis melo var. makuwa]|uniref:Uncharacterized protein n=1 Tax=Cucumis melo var. makuwa TaxID=1194695 RepID=A0A5D3E3S7_CUCMM|nr:hypothetical protein E5676_scaffold343G00590 [Cucumis melo var. makuwa]